MLRQSLSLKTRFKIRGNLRGTFWASWYAETRFPGLADKSRFKCGMQRLSLGLYYPVCYLDLLPRFITRGWQV